MVETRSSVLSFARRPESVSRARARFFSFSSASRSWLCALRKSSVPTPGSKGAFLSFAQRSTGCEQPLHQLRLATRELVDRPQGNRGFCRRSTASAAGSPSCLSLRARSFRAAVNSSRGRPYSRFSSWSTDRLTRSRHAAWSVRAASQRAWRLTSSRTAPELAPAVGAAIGAGRNVSTDRRWVRHSGPPRNVRSPGGSRRSRAVNN